MRLILILQCMLGLQSQSIDFKNASAQPDITRVDDVVKCDFVIRLKKSLYSQVESTRLWHEITIFFVRLRFCGDQGGSIPVNI